MLLLQRDSGPKPFRKEYPCYSKDVILEFIIEDNALYVTNTTVFHRHDIIFCHHHVEASCPSIVCSAV